MATQKKVEAPSATTVSKALSQTETKASMTNATEASSLVTKAIASSKAHETDLHKAAVYGLFFLCEHGSPSHLNKLFLGVSANDRLAIRIFLRNTHEALKANVVKIVSKASETTTAGIHVADNSKEARALLVSKGYKWLEDIQWTTQKDENRIDISADAAIERLVKSAAKRLSETYPANPIVAEFVKSLKSAGDFAETQMKNWKAVQELAKAGYKIEEPAKATGTTNG